MARGAGTVTINIVGDATKLKKSLTEADQGLKGFGDKVSGVGTKMTAMVSVPIIGFLGAATKAAAEDEQAQALLAKTLENTTGATKAQVASVEEQLAKFMKVSTFSDDELRPAFARLVTSTKDVDEANKLMATAMDISAATGKPLQTVVDGLAKAHDGNVGALSRLGIQTKDTEGKTLEFQTIMEQANTTFGGSAANALDTTAGRSQALKRDMGELTEEIGAQLLPAMEKIAKFVADTLLPALDGLSGENGAILLVAAALTGPLIKAIQGVYGALTWLAAHPMILVLATLVEELIRLEGLFEKQKTQKGGFLGALKGALEVAPIIGIPKKLGLKIPGLAAGGPVAAGRPFVVGERGPELFVPSQAGRIVPGGGGGTVVNVTVNGWVGDDVALTRKIIAALQGEARRSGALGLA